MVGQPWKLASPWQYGCQIHCSPVYSSMFCCGFNIQSFSVNVLAKSNLITAKYTHNQILKSLQSRAEMIGWIISHPIREKLSARIMIIDVNVSVIYQAKTNKGFLLQPLQCEDTLILYDRKFNFVGFWTVGLKKQDIWRHHLCSGELWWTFFTIFRQFTI